MDIFLEIIFKSLSANMLLHFAFGLYFVFRNQCRNYISNSITCVYLWSFQKETLLNERETSVRQVSVSIVECQRDVPEHVLYIGSRRSA